MQAPAVANFPPLSLTLASPDDSPPASGDILVQVGLSVYISAPSCQGQDYDAVVIRRGECVSVSECVCLCAQGQQKGS